MTKGHKFACSKSKKKPQTQLHAADLQFFRRNEGKRKQYSEFKNSAALPTIGSVQASEGHNAVVAEFLNFETKSSSAHTLTNTAILTLVTLELNKKAIQLLNGSYYQGKRA